MKLMSLTLALTLGVGYLLGGRMSNLARLRIRWAPLAVVGFAMQLINPPGRWPLVMLLGSFVLLSTFAIVNRRTLGFGLILVGVTLNFLVIAVNAGMPVSAEALRTSGQEDTIGALTDRADAYVKHHLAGPEDRALALGDVIGLPPPVAQAISLGDIFTYGGVAVVIVAGMRRKPEDDGVADALVAEGDRAAG